MTTATDESSAAIVAASAKSSAAPRKKWWKVGLCVAAAAAGFALTAHGPRIDDPRDAQLSKLPVPVDGDIPRFARVHSYLYRGAFPSMRGIDDLKAMGVKTIIDLRIRKEPVEVEEVQAQLLGMRYISLPTGDFLSNKTQDVFLSTVEEASKDPTKAPVFVHCGHGSDRTGLVCALWRVKHDGWSAVEAASEMLRHGYLIHRLEPFKPRNR